MAYLGIKVPEQVGRMLASLRVPGEKEAPSEYHITLVCFEDNWSIKQMLKTIRATYEIVGKVEPFRVKADRVSHFPPRPDHPIPIIAPVKSEELRQLHKKISKALDAEKVAFKKTFKEYKPHITLAYSKEEHDDFRLDAPIEFAVNEVVLWGGNEDDAKLFTTFQLRAPERRKSGAVVKMAEVYERLTRS